MIHLLEEVASRGKSPALTATSADGEVVRLGGEHLAATVARAATMLQRHGVEPGTVVGIHLDNSAGLEALVLH
jgi:acyl-CoA synthetase (AMP-forming)/AMP-acid ligase II